MNPVNLNDQTTNGTALPNTNGAVFPSKNGVSIAINGAARTGSNGASTNGTQPLANGVGANTNGEAAPEPATKSPSVPRELHRIGEVRVQQGTSLRSVSRKMNLSVQEIREQESGTKDLRISDLLKWQEVLEVPLSDLLVDSEGPLSEPVCKRARMLRIMKTAKAIQEGAHNRSIVRLANMLIGQLVEIMPELSDVAAWHTVGQRRTQDEMGRIVERSIPDNFFNDSIG